MTDKQREIAYQVYDAIQVLFKYAFINETQSQTLIARLKEKIEELEYSEKKWIEIENGVYRKNNKTVVGSELLQEIKNLEQTITALKAQQLDPVDADNDKQREAFEMYNIQYDTGDQENYLEKLNKIKAEITTDVSTNTKI